MFLPSVNDNYPNFDLHYIQYLPHKRQPSLQYKFAGIHLYTSPQFWSQQLLLSADTSFLVISGTLLIVVLYSKRTFTRENYLNWVTS